MKHRFLPLRLNFGVCIIFVSLFSGCASPNRQPYDVISLIRFEPDCRHRAEQLSFLDSILPTDYEEKNARAKLKLGLVFGNYEETRMIADGTMERIILDDIEMVGRRCGN